MDHCLVVKGLTKLSDAMSHAMRAIQDGRVILQRIDKTWSSGGGNGKPLWYTSCENLVKCIKRQKDMTPKDESPIVGSVVVVPRPSCSMVCGILDLSFLTRDQTRVPYTARWTLNLWICAAVSTWNQSIWRDPYWYGPAPLETSGSWHWSPPAWG